MAAAAAAAAATTTFLTSRYGLTSCESDVRSSFTVITSSCITSPSIMPDYREEKKLNLVGFDNRFQFIKLHQMWATRFDTSVCKLVNYPVAALKNITKDKNTCDKSKIPFLEKTIKNKNTFYKQKNGVARLSNDWKIGISNPSPSQSVSMTSARHLTHMAPQKCEWLRGDRRRLFSDWLQHQQHLPSLPWKAQYKS